MNLKGFFWLLFAITIGIYGTMLFWSLPKIMTDSGGLLPFDLRPQGYSFAEAQQMLSAFSLEGTEFYKNIQAGILDMIYPILMFFTLALAYYLLSPTKWGKWRFALILVPLPAAIFDYLENFSVINLLTLGTGNITPELVKCASTNTIIKSYSVTISLVLLIVLIIYWGFRRIKEKEQK